MPELAKRMSRLQPYTFAEIDAAEKRAREKGLEVISMGIGDPDHDPPLWIREILCEEVRRSGNHNYPDYKGHPLLWDAAIRYMDRRFGVSGLEHKHLVTTIGSKEGLSKLTIALVNPGDIVVMPDPNYPVFGTLSMLEGGQVRFLGLNPGNNFQPDIRSELGGDADRVRALYLNYPHNPTGQVASREYLEGLVNWARETGAVIISDAAYAEIYFGEGNRPSSLFEFDGALECVVELHSFSKSFNITGWRVGFAVGASELVQGLTTIKTHADSGVFNAIQLTMARVLDDPRCEPFLAENRALYMKRRDTVCDALEGAGLTCHRSGGSIFLWCGLPEDAPCRQDGLKDSFAWCTRLLDETGVVVSPGVGFGSRGEGYFRISLTIEDTLLDKALERLANFARR